MSACQRKCALDEQGHRCLGCGRTMAEIIQKGLEARRRRQMAHHEMLTVGGYHPLASGGNTIRKLSEKYRDLRPGDTVHMTYTSALVDGRPSDVLARERLTVTAVAIAPFDAIIDMHWEHNHGEPADPDEMAEIIASLYGEPGEGDLFMAVYF